MEDNEILVNGIKYVRADKKMPASIDGDFVIVRCTGAGVHAGYIQQHDNQTVTLKNSLRLWQWHGRTLSGLAVEGPDEPARCKFGPVQPQNILNGWLEIAHCTTAARIALQAVPEWENDD